MFTVHTEQDTRIKGKCNTIFGDDAPAVGGDHAVDFLVVSAFKMSILPPNTHFAQNAYNFPAFWNSRSRAGIPCIENQAAIRAGQLAQQEGVPVFLKEPPHLRLFPSPARTELFESEGRTITSKLNRRGQMRKHVVGIPPPRMTPKVQPRVGFFKLILRIRQALCDISR
jgi:hypothetical protein